MRIYYGPLTKMRSIIRPDFEVRLCKTREYLVSRKSEAERRTENTCSGLDRQGTDRAVDRIAKTWPRHGLWIAWLVVSLAGKLTGR